MLKIAVDFDGTVVEDAYPEIGKQKPFALETLKKLSKMHKIILWTCRTGELLDNAVKYLEDAGVNIHAVNADSPDEAKQPLPDDRKFFMRKIDADLFIDDRNFNGFPGWGNIWRKLSGESDTEPEPQPKKKKWFWQ